MKFVIEQSPDGEHWQYCDATMTEVLAMALTSNYGQLDKKSFYRYRPVASYHPSDITNHLRKNHAS
jgi:hypothetical protein